MSGLKCEPDCGCGRHSGNGQKTGRKRTSNPGAIARHDRVRYARGNAKIYPCMSCGERANDWAQVHGSDPLDIFGYLPLCRKCHIEYDEILTRPDRLEIMSQLMRQRWRKPEWRERMKAVNEMVNAPRRKNRGD